MSTQNSINYHSSPLLVTTNPKASPGRSAKAARVSSVASSAVVVVDVVDGLPFGVGNAGKGETGWKGGRKTYEN